MAKAVVRFKEKAGVRREVLNSTLYVEGVRRQAIAIMRAYAGNIQVYGEAIRPRMGIATRKRTAGTRVYVGTWSTFAHWEEFGNIRTNPPTGAFRNAIRSLWEGEIDWAGANSEKGPRLQ